VPMETALTVPARSVRRSGPGVGARTMARVAKGQNQRADIFRSGRAPDEHTEQDGAMRRRLLQQSDQGREREQEEGRDKDVLLEDAGMDDKERCRRRGRGRSQ